MWVVIERYDDLFQRKHCGIWRAGLGFNRSRLVLKSGIFKALTSLFRKFVSSINCFYHGDNLFNQFEVVQKRRFCHRWSGVKLLLGQILLTITLLQHKSSIRSINLRQKHLNVVEILFYQNMWCWRRKLKVCEDGDDSSHFGKLKIIFWAAADIAKRVERKLFLT